MLNNSGIALLDWLHDCLVRNLFSPSLGLRPCELELMVLSYMHGGAWIRIPLKTQAYALLYVVRICRLSHGSVNNYSNERAAACIFTLEDRHSGSPERLVLGYHVTRCYISEDRNLSNEMLGISGGRSSIDPYTRWAPRNIRWGRGADHEAIYNLCLILKIML